LKIALACHRRIVVNDPRIELGLPEVTLGLLPGAGGIVRTVRLLRLQPALMGLLLQGQRVRPEQALSMGLIHELAASPDAALSAARGFVLTTKTSQQPWDQRGYQLPGGSPTSPALAANLPAFPANLQKQLKGANYPA